MDSRALASRLVEIARAEVGVREEGGNNRGSRIVEYQKATNLNTGAWPWCAAFTCWVMREWLADDAVREALNKTRNDAERWRCKFAGAFRWESWARTRGVKILTENDSCRAGDFVIFDFSHIGIVGIGGHPGQVLETIEGNTGPAGGRDSTTGDGVWIKSRRHSPELIRSFVRVVP